MVRSYGGASFGSIDTLVDFQGGGPLVQLQNMCKCEYEKEKGMVHTGVEKTCPRFVCDIFRGKVRKGKSIYVSIKGGG